MATIKGVWIWKDPISNQAPYEVTASTTKHATVLFTVPGIDNIQYTGVRFTYDSSGRIEIAYMQSGGATTVKYGWESTVQEKFRTIDFGENDVLITDYNVAVGSTIFLEWFTDNATKKHVPGEHHGGIAPWCETEGQRDYYICEECGAKVDEDGKELTSLVIPPLGHDIVEHPAKRPTCTDIGWNAYKTCTRCDYTTFVAIPATGHEWEGATCTQPRMCANCGLTEGEPLGHNWVEATGATPKTCTRCGATEGEQYGINVIDSDERFVIDPKTRMITNLSGKNKVLQFDHNSERFTFEMPKYIEGFNVMHCDKVEVHYNNISSDGNVVTRNVLENPGVYEVKNLRPCPDDNNKVMFSWLISDNATQYNGTLNFLIRFVELDGEIPTYAWHTEVFEDIIVSKGKNNGGAVVTRHPDVLEAWKNTVHAEYLKKADAAEVYATKEEAATKDELTAVAEESTLTFATKDELVNMRVQREERLFSLDEHTDIDSWGNVDTAGNRYPIEAVISQDGVLTISNSNASFGMMSFLCDYFFQTAPCEMTMTFSMQGAGVEAAVNPNCIRGGIFFGGDGWSLEGTFAHIRGDGEYCIQTYSNDSYVGKGYSFDSRDNKINAEYQVGEPYTLKLNFIGDGTYTFTVYDKNGVQVAQKAGMPIADDSACIGVFCRNATLTVTDFSVTATLNKIPNTCDVYGDEIHTTYARKNEVTKVYEYEREFFYVEKTDGLDYSDPNSPQPIRIFDRTYSGKTLDFGQVILSGYVNWNGKSCYICHDITRQLQSMEDGMVMATRLGGVYCVLGDYNIAFYDFKLDLERKGNQYTAIASNLVIGAGTSASARASKVATMSNLVMRTILYNKVTVI